MGGRILQLAAAIQGLHDIASLVVVNCVASSPLPVFGCITCYGIYFYQASAIY